MADELRSARPEHGSHARRQSVGTLPGLTPKSRVRRACDRCRELRARCSGGVRCDKCTRDDATCIYSDNKREMRQKSYTQAIQQVGTQQDENAALLSVLRSVADHPNFQPAEHPDVLRVLEIIKTRPRPNSVESISSTPGPELPDGYKAMGSRDSGAESNMRSDIGSPKGQQELPHTTSLNGGAGLAGYIGKLSEASWLQRAREHLFGQAPLLQPDVNANRFDFHVLQTMDLTYFMDDQDPLSTSEEHLTRYQFPDLGLALVLTEAYFNCLHGAFHFVDRENFITELIAQSVQSPSWPNPRFLALANMMWAVGAKWLEICQLDHNGVSEGHSVYYARARALGLDHRIHLDHPNIQLVQGTGLLAFYLMVNGSVQRAWCITGEAIRYAIALGLHLRVAPDAIDKSSQEKRAKIWYSLYRLEVLLSEVTGRPKAINLASVSVPIDLLSRSDGVQGNESTGNIESQRLWSQFIEENDNMAVDGVGEAGPGQPRASNDSVVAHKHFVAATELSKIADIVEDRLYLAPEDNTWLEVQESIGRLEERLLIWQENIPMDLVMGDLGDRAIDHRSSMDLEMYRCSVGMILYRPFLCDIHFEGQSATSRDFNSQCAKGCIAAALDLLEMMPDHPISSQIHQVVPWWSVLHYICQAAAVLMLELCLNAQHIQGRMQIVVAALSKVMSYLRCCSSGSKSAYKAWVILRSLLQHLMPRYKVNTFDAVQVDANKPDAWSEADEAMLEVTMQALR